MGYSFKAGSGYTTYKIISANDFGHYSNTGNISILNDNSGGVIRFAAGGSTTAQMTLGITGGLLLGTTSATDALGLSGSSYANLNLSSGTSIFSFSGNTNQPYFAVTNGTIQVFGGHANPTDGAVFGSFSNHKLTLRTNNTNRLEITNGGNVLIGTTTDVSRRLHVSGEARITDLATDPPTRIVGADADGDLGALALSGLSITSGILTAASIYNLLPVGNTRVDANSYSLTLDSLTRFNISSTNHTSEFGTGAIAQIKKLNASGTKYFDNYRQYDSRTTISNGTNIATGPSYSNLFVYNRGSGEEYEWTDLHVLDTTNNVFGHMYGSRYKNGLNAFRAQRPSSGGAYNLTPAFDFRQEAYGNGANGAQLLGVRIGNDTMMSIKQSGSLELDLYGTGNKEAADLSKTQSSYIAGFATDGTVLDLERKRDTTIYVTDADYNFSAAITSANILKRYNRIIIYSKLTSGSTSDNQIFLHTPSSDFLQCTIIIYSNDASADSDATSIDFTTNGAVDGSGGTLSSYAMTAGQRVEIRVADDGGYKWFFN